MTTPSYFVLRRAQPTCKECKLSSTASKNGRIEKMPTLGLSSLAVQKIVFEVLFQRPNL